MTESGRSSRRHRKTQKRGSAWSRSPFLFFLDHQFTGSPPVARCRVPAPAVRVPPFGKRASPHLRATGFSHGHDDLFPDDGLDPVDIPADVDQFIPDPLRDGREFLGAGGILLDDLVHLHHGAADLIDPLGLLPGRLRDLADQVRHLHGDVPVPGELPAHLVEQGRGLPRLPRRIGDQIFRIPAPRQSAWPGCGPPRPQRRSLPRLRLPGPPRWRR